MASTGQLLDGKFHLYLDAEGVDGELIEHFGTIELPQTSPNELTEHQQGLVSLVKGNELGDIIKPMIKEIPLFDSYIAGTTHLDDKTGLDKTKINRNT